MEAMGAARQLIAAVEQVADAVDELDGGLLEADDVLAAGAVCIIVNAAAGFLPFLLGARLAGYSTTNRCCGHDNCDDRDGDPKRPRGEAAYSLPLSLLRILRIGIGNFGVWLFFSCDLF